MSGSNPFRPRKQPEALPVTANPTDLSAAPPTTIPSLPAVAAPSFDGVPHQSHVPASTQDNVDDARSSDDEDSTTTDPFGQASYLSDDGGDYRIEDGGPPTQNPVASPNSASSSGTSTRRPLPVPPTGSRTVSSSNTDVRPASISGSTIARRPSNASIDSRALASRPANREKKPPPPPKNHRGKLINPPSGGSSPAIQQPSPDYFTPGPNNDENLDVREPPDTLRRSQSHYKRPPTPPVSRRHSQMRRSKSTVSQANSNRLSMPVGKTGATDASPPSSPGVESSTPSVRSMRQAPSRSSPSLRTDDNISSREDHYPALSSPTGEMSSPGKISARRTSAQGASSAAATTATTTATTTAAAAAAAPPPPPPPRRAARPVSTILPGKPGQEEAFPHPSNANHILQDLTRLQKEVDDLRGRYENRKSVNI